MHFKRFKSYTYAFLWPRWNETRNQQQKENWKYVEIKQHTLNQSMVKEEITREIRKNILR